MRTLLPFILLALLLAGPVAGAPLDDTQQACANHLAGALGKQAAAAGKELSRCAKRAAKGKALDKRNPDVQSVDACVLLDPRGKLAKLDAKTTRRAAGSCTDPLPAFAPADPAAVRTRSEASVLALIHDLLGADLGKGALAMEKKAAKCQQSAWGAVARCHDARLDAYAACQEDALAAGAASAEELAASCLGAGQPDPKGKVARSCTSPQKGIAKALAKKCAGQDLATLLPSCGGDADPAGCLATRAACRVCEAVAVAGLLPVDCDLFDDGTTNGSCSGGPTQLACVSPAQGAMLQLPDGESIQFMGITAGGFAVDEVTVGGLPVPVAEDGSFEATIGTEFGTNFVEVLAEDGLGRTHTSTCAFVASESYLAEDVFLDDALALKLLDAAVDDENTGDPLDSFNDVLHTVAHSDGLRDELHQALLAANPLKPNSCDEEVCTFLGCVCLFRSSVTYDDLTVEGPHTTSLDLIADGVLPKATIRNVELFLTVGGTLSASGSASFASTEVDLSSRVSLQGGLPSTMTTVNRVAVGNVDLEVGGLVGLIVDVLETLFQGTIRNLVRDLIRDYLRDNFDDVLEGLLANLEIPSAVIDAAGVPVTLEGEFSSLSFSTARALFGLGTRFTPATGHPTPSLGIPLIPNPSSSDPPTSEAALLAAQVGALNQALHALWRGGLLHATLTAAEVPGLPAGSVLELTPSLAPVANGLSGDQLSIEIGALRAIVTLPGIFDAPTPLVAGGEAIATLSIANDRLVFGAPTIQTLHLSGVDALDVADRALLEGALRLVLQDRLDEALAGTSLALEIPAFVFPDSFASFDLTPGDALGIVEPALTTTPSHAHAEGPLGLLP